MKQTIIYLFLCLSAGLSSCELAGLELQRKYDYDDKAGVYSNELKMTTLEFIHSRPDLFSLLIEGIEHAGIENSFREPNSTYMLPTNTAFNATAAANLSYFETHRLPNPGYDPEDPETGDSTLVALSLTQFPKEEVRQLLLYHIAKGEWTWSNLPAEPTWYDTHASGDSAKVNLYLMKNDRSPTIAFNNFATHYKVPIVARTTNLRATNSSYVHVLDSWLDLPTRRELRLE